MRKNASKELYKQVYDYVVNQIKQREWKEYDKLPSVRALAKEFKVHRLTVLKAFQLLKEDEILYVKDKSGYFVGPEKVLKENEGRTISTYVENNHLSAIHQVPAAYQFSKALIDPGLLPNKYFSEYVKRVFDLYPKVLGTYSNVQGDNELRYAFSSYLLKTYRFYASQDELLITSGAQQAIDLLAKTLIQPKDTILVERPTYSTAIDIFRQYGANIVGVEIGPSGYDLSELEHYMKNYRPRLFYVNPTFHNPTGYTVPVVQRKRLVELAEEYQCVIIEDDPFRDIYFQGKPPLPIYTFDTEGYVIYIRGFSKYVSPGLRIAVVVCKHPLMKNLIIAKSLADNGTSLLDQKIFLLYFFSERMQIHLSKLRTALYLRKEIMERELNDTSWKWTSPGGGFTLWVEMPEGLAVDQLLKSSIKHSLTFVPGIICDTQGRMGSWIRLSYSYANEEQIQKGIRLLIQTSNDLMCFD